jgi:hypothetical protein
MTDYGFRESPFEYIEKMALDDIFFRIPQV